MEVTILSIVLLVKTIFKTFLVVLAILMPVFVLLINARIKQIRNSVSILETIEKNIHMMAKKSVPEEVKKQQTQNIIKIRVLCEKCNKWYDKDLNSCPFCKEPTS